MRILAFHRISCASVRYTSIGWPESVKTTQGSGDADRAMALRGKC